VKVTTLRPETLQATMKSWLQYIDNISQNQLAGLVQLITSVKIIHSVKKDATTLVRTSEWPRLCQNLHLPEDLDFYKRFYQHLVNARIKEIIRSSWQRTMAETQQDVVGLLNQRHESAFNLHCHVWTEEPADNPKSLQEVVQRSKGASRLLMKCKGYEPAIVELFQRMDAKVEALYGDLSIYLKNDGVFVAGRAGGDAETDGIVAFLRDCTRDSISE
jgi:conserved oligomeric Golgi complex subunit 1